MTLLEDKTELDDEQTRPAYYGGPDNPFEPVKVIHKAGLGAGFYYGSALKYLQRAGKKGDQEMSDLKKALWYLSNGRKLGYEMPDLGNTEEWLTEVSVAWAQWPLSEVIQNVLSGTITIDDAVIGLEEHIEHRKQELQEE